MESFESTAPLVEAMAAARKSGMMPMQIPGHKWQYLPDSEGALGHSVLYDLIRDDIPLQGGADDNAFSNGYLVQAEALYARAIGAEHTRFLVGGSSQGNIAAFLTIARDGGLVAVDRTSHRSALAGMVLSGAMPRWIYPTIHPEFGLPIGMPASAIDDAADASAVFITSPAYVGTMTDLAPIVAKCHAAGHALVVDQAWGAHLDFGVPGHASAMALGADLVVTSTHKALMGYSQTATISSSGRIIDSARLDRAVDTTATTSPSATLLASIDATRFVMETEGAAAIERAMETTEAARAMLRRVPGVVVIDDSTAGCSVDPLKLTVWLPRTGCTGVEIAAELWKQGHGVETADNDTLVMTVTVADRRESVLDVVEKVVALIEAKRREPHASMPSAVWSIRPDVVMTPRAAVFAPRKRIALRDAAGLVSAEQFCPYPPGVPLLGPGELVTQEVIEAVGIAGGLGRVAYCSDPTLQTIEVVDL